MFQEHCNSVQGLNGDRKINESLNISEGSYCHYRSECSMTQTLFTIQAFPVGISAVEICGPETYSRFIHTTKVTNIHSSSARLSQQLDYGPVWRPRQAFISAFNTFMAILGDSSRNKWHPLHWRIHKADIENQRAPCVKLPYNFAAVNSDTWQSLHLPISEIQKLPSSCLLPRSYYYLILS